MRPPHSIPGDEKSFGWVGIDGFMETEVQTKLAGLPDRTEKPKTLRFQ